MTIMPSVVRQTKAVLGEGPAWLQDEKVLHYVDIKSGAIHRLNTITGAHETRHIGGKPGFVLPAAGGGLIIGSEDGLYHGDGEAIGTRIATVPMPAHNRINDGTVDCHGRLWFGTMDDEERQGTGAIYCFAAGALYRMAGGAVVTNGPAVSSDGRTLYHVDSGNRIIWRTTVGKGPDLQAPEPFVRLSEADGHPDGVVLDSEQCLWVALWDGWGVRRYAPDGRLLLHVDLPCARVTKLAFGGDDLRTAFVTTARVGLDDAALAAQPLAGSLFAFEAPVAGLPLPAVRLSSTLSGTAA